MEAFIFIVLFLVIFGIFYVYISARNRERMAIIDKGTEFDLSIFENKKRFNFQGLLIRFGFLSVGVGLGIVVAIILENSMYDIFHHHVWNGNGDYNYTMDNSPPLYFAMIFIFGGLGLIAGYFAGRRKVD
jgi:hypothetical protein